MCRISDGWNSWESCFSRADTKPWRVHRYFCSYIRDWREEAPGYSSIAVIQKNPIIKCSENRIRTSSCHSSANHPSRQHQPPPPSPTPCLKHIHYTHEAYNIYTSPILPHLITSICTTSSSPTPLPPSIRSMPRLAKRGIHDRRLVVPHTRRELLGQKQKSTDHRKSHTLQQCNLKTGTEPHPYLQAIGHKSPDPRAMNQNPRVHLRPSPIRNN